MKTRLLFVSLFLISVLVISGCDKEKTIERSSFPDQLFGYKLDSFELMTQECDTLPDGSEVCGNHARIVYDDYEANSQIHLLPTYFTKGKEEGLQYLLGISTYIDSGVYRLEPHELYWKSVEYDIFAIQEYKYIEIEDEYDTVKYNTIDISTENQFVKYFLDKYPPLIE